MKKILIIGASGSISKIVEERLLEQNSEIELTLLLRYPSKLPNNVRESKKVIVVQADVFEEEKVVSAALRKDAVYVNLYGQDLKEQAKAVVSALTKAKTSRIIWMSANGIYNELPKAYGDWNAKMLGSTLKAYADSAKIIEQSSLDYTIIRPAWFQNKNEITYEKYPKGSPFKGTEISRKSVADYVVHLLLNLEEAIHESIGISKPGTDGEKPSFY